MSETEQKLTLYGKVETTARRVEEKLSKADVLLSEFVAKFLGLETPKDGADKAPIPPGELNVLHDVLRSCEKKVNAILRSAEDITKF